MKNWIACETKDCGPIRCVTGTCDKRGGRGKIAITAVNYPGRVENCRMQAAW